MPQYEVIREMPLNELLMYHQALKEICNNYEYNIRPLYNSHNPNDKKRWIEINNQYQHAKMYYDLVINALTYKSFNGLDNYEKPDDALKMKNVPKIRKKSASIVKRGRKAKKKVENKELA